MSSIKCPSVINYSKISSRKHIRVRTTAAASKKGDKLPKVYYHIKVSSVNASHTCKLDTSNHIIAIQNSGNFSIEPEKFDTIMRDLQENINMNRHVLHGKLKFMVPPYILNQDKFFDSFRNRVINKLINEFDYSSYSVNDYNSLLDPKLCAVDEVVIDDKMLYSQNLKTLLRSTINGNGDDIWDVKKFMKAIKKVLILLLCTI